MEKKKKIIISVLVVLAIIIIIVGATYAYFYFVTNSGNVATTNGNLDIYYEISEPSLTGVLIPSATRSGGVMDTATAKLNTGSVAAAINFYITPTSISGFPLSALSYDVDVINTSNEVLYTFSGDFSTASLNSPLKIVDGYDLSTSLLTFNIYIWLDGSKINNENFNSNNSFTATISADTVPVTGVFELEPNPITDYSYTLLEHEDTGYTDDYVVLNSYTGSSSVVVIPDTYTIDNKEYKTALYIPCGNGDPASRPTTFRNNKTVKTVVLPDNYMVYYKETSSSAFVLTNTTMEALFCNCTNLKNVQNMPSTITSLYYTFSGCTSLVTAPTIPNSVTNMNSTFSGCTSLVNAPTLPPSVTTMNSTFSGCTSLVAGPTIPNSVTNMWRTFAGCTSLVSAQAIPNSVTNMFGTFSGCTSLVNAPTIGNSVENMINTFENCTSLVTAPAIPSSATDMTDTFRGCSSLTGTVRINSTAVTIANVSNNAANHSFYQTVQSITVEVPVNSTTYTSINTNKPNNVTVTTFTPE